MKPYRPMRPGAIPDVLTPEQWERLPERPRSGDHSRVSSENYSNAARHYGRSLAQARDDAERMPPYVVLRYSAATVPGATVRILDVTGPFLSQEIARQWATDNRTDGGFSVLPVTVPAMRDLLAQGANAQ